MLGDEKEEQGEASKCEGLLRSVMEEQRTVWKSNGIELLRKVMEKRRDALLRKGIELLRKVTA